MAVAGFGRETEQRPTRDVPTVTDFSEDPVAAGLITSLARPSANLTGVTQKPGLEFYDKQLQLLQEIAPRLSRVAFLGPKDQLQSYRAAAPPAGVAVIPALLDAPEQYEEAFATVLRERADALLVGGSPVSYTQLRRTMKFEADNTLPAIYPYREAAEASGLLLMEATLKGAFAKPQGCGRAVCHRQSGRRAARAPSGAGMARYNITVNAIAPGPFVANISGGRLRDPALRAPFEKFSPMRRLGEPDDIKGLALFLASPAAAFITGAQIVIDGGMTLGMAD